MKLQVPNSIAFKYTNKKLETSEEDVDGDTLLDMFNTSLSFDRSMRQSINKGVLRLI